MRQIFGVLQRHFVVGLWGLVCYKDIKKGPNVDFFLLVHHKQSYLSCLLSFFDYSSKEFQQRTYNLHRDTKSHNLSSFKKIQTLTF